jgi:hypothetical protein
MLLSIEKITKEPKRFFVTGGSHTGDLFYAAGEMSCGFCWSIEKGEAWIKEIF